MTCPPLKNTKRCNTTACPVDCAWSDWGEWSPCSKSCGGGTRTRTREIKQNAENGGKACPAKSTDMSDCNTQPCPIDCQVSNWSKWSSCSESCGPGTQTRTRTVVTKPQYEGKACPPQLTETSGCIVKPCPIDCVVGKWSNLGTCSKSCGGGQQLRTRTVVTKPKYGGKACPPTKENIACNTQSCSPCKINWPTTAETLYHTLSLSDKFSFTEAATNTPGWKYDWGNNSGKIDLVVPFTQTNDCITPPDGILSTTDISSADSKILDAYNNKNYTCNSTTGKCTIQDFYQPIPITKKNTTCVNNSNYRPTKTSMPPWWWGSDGKSYTSPLICNSDYYCGRAPYSEAGVCTSAAVEKAAINQYASLFGA